MPARQSPSTGTAKTGKSPVAKTEAVPRKVATRLAQADDAAIREAAVILSGGGLIAFPTETVYGLGADATNPLAVARLYEAKGRPAFNPLIAHVGDLAAAERIGTFDAMARRLAIAFWPGPLTLVVPARKDTPVCDLARAGLSTVAIRVPSHPVARKLITATRKPVVAPSANRSGHVSPTTASHVMSDLRDKVDFVLNGGPTQVGVESTIVACLDGGPTLLRAGGLTRHDIEAVIGHALSGPAVAGDDLLAPGQLASHYAPRARVKLDVAKVTAGQALLAFGPLLPPGTEKAAQVLNLSPTGDLAEAAANLFAHLRTLDASATTIAVMPIPDEGLGEAINDRLARSAADRHQD
jgi:L-threonylcarbamoyladenylate synthase